MFTDQMSVQKIQMLMLMEDRGTFRHTPMNAVLNNRVLFPIIQSGCENKSQLLTYEEVLPDEIIYAKNENTSF